MFTAGSIWGVDIGESSIKAVLLKKENETLHLLDFDHIELDKELKAKEGDLPVLREALENLFNRLHLSRSEVCLSISAKDVNSRFITLPGGLKQKDFNKTVIEEAEKQIPFPLEEVEWGFHRLPDKDDKAQIALFAVRREKIEEILSTINTNKVKVRGIQVPGLALYNYISWVADLKEHMIVLDFGEKTTDLLVVHDGGFWLRSMPISGQHITELLEKKFRITSAEACKLKHEMENSPQRDKLFRVIEPKLREMVTEIKRSINFRRTQVRDLKPTKFVAYGGSAKLAGVADYFSQQLGLEKLNLEETKVLDCSRCENSERFLSGIASYGVALGLAIQGLGEAESEVNLIPRKEVARQLLRQKRPFVAVANAALVLTMLLMYLAGSNVSKNLSAMSDRIKTEADAARTANTKFENQKNAMSPVKNEAEFIIRLSKGGDFVAHIYDTVCSILEQCPNVTLMEFKVGPIAADDYTGTREKGSTGEAKRGGRSGMPPPGMGPPGMDLDPNVMFARGASANSGVVVSLAYVGPNAESNTVFHKKLTSHKLFSLIPLPMPVSNNTEVAIKSSSVIVSDDMIQKITEPELQEKIRTKRKELKWDEFQKEKGASIKYSMNVQKLDLPVNMDYFLKPPEADENNVDAKASGKEEPKAGEQQADPREGRAAN